MLFLCLPSRLWEAWAYGSGRHETVIKCYLVTTHYSFKKRKNDALKCSGKYSRAAQKSPPSAVSSFDIGSVNTLCDTKGKRHEQSRQNHLGRGAHRKFLRSPSLRDRHHDGIAKPPTQRRRLVWGPRRGELQVRRDKARIKRDLQCRPKWSI